MAYAYHKMCATASVLCLSWYHILGMCETGDLVGRGIDLQLPADKGQQAQKYDFSFDKVFMPEASQVRNLDWVGLTPP